MGITRILYPWLSVRGIGIIEGLIISSLSVLQSTLILIRHPLLFDQELPSGFFQLSRLFLASPTAIGIVGGLVIGYLVTGVVLPGKESPERWNIRQTLIATGIVVGGELVSVVLMNLGFLFPSPWGFGFIAAGFFLGPWMRAQLPPRTDRSAAPPRKGFSWRSTRRQAMHTLLIGVPGVAIAAADALSMIFVLDNRRFVKDEKASMAQFGYPEDPSIDSSIKVARLSSGLVRYRVVNPQGRRLVLGFHGFQESLEEFPPSLEAALKKIDMQGIFIDRPGIGPVSTPQPGLNLAAWPRLVEEFDREVLDKQPISIIGHSAGGVYALACAKLACVRALALVCSPIPMTVGSLLRTLYHHDVQYDPAEIGVELLPHSLIPLAQQACQQILNDWPSYFKEMLNVVGPFDRAFLTQNENEFRKNTVTSALQGAEALIEDLRGFLSPWPLTRADTARLPILIFNGAGDEIVRPSAAQELESHFAPNALLFPPFKDMGHFPALTHYELIFAELAKVLVQKEETLAHARLES
jgi:pimeloyl-ACP methyl ester carboxylesterase